MGSPFSYYRKKATKGRFRLQIIILRGEAWGELGKVIIILFETIWTAKRTFVASLWVTGRNHPLL